jgi:type I restriction enzyme S subunit
MTSAPLQQTDLGLLPPDWSVSTVGAEFHVELGKMLDQEKNVGLPKPFLGNRSVQWGKVVLDDIGQIRLTAQELPRFRLRYGDLLVCEGGEVGRSAIWRDELPECYYQKALHRLRAKSGYRVELMAAVLERYSVTGRIQDYVTQTSIAHLPKDKFLTLPIPVPANDGEQAAIAQALTDADSLIDSLEQVLTKQRRIKQGAMQELLTGKRRLPGFVGVWQSTALGTIASVQRGASPRPIDSPEWFDDSSAIGWVRISDVTQAGMYLDSTTQYLSAAGIKSSRFVATGSLIMSICATVGRPVITKLDACIHDGFVLFSDLQIDKDFLYYVLRWMEDSWSKHGQTGSQMNLNTGLINSAPLFVPPDPAEQHAIAQVLTDMDASLTALQARLTKARQLKQALMQVLLTGRIRLLPPGAAAAGASPA